MRPDQKHDIPDGLNEEYYQISGDILGSFNKYRPPLNIFMFKEDVARVMPFFKVGGRLTNEQVAELAEITKEGLVFVSREDHPVYVKHISYQLDLVLVDKNLKEKEIADIFTQALTRRLAEFFEQPVIQVFEKLWVDLMVLSEYLYADIRRARALVRRLHTEHTLENHSVNTGFLGVALWGKLKEKGFAEAVKRKSFDRVLAGLFLHDLGMAKVPLFLRTKDKPLTGEERNKINAHTKVGFEMLSKLNLRYAEIEQCVSEHHERINGSGYPLKSVKQEFPGRLTAVADSFCAMISKRPYAEAMGFVQAASALAQDAKYDREITKALQMLIMLDLKMK
ncbi:MULTISPECIES: HD domain-containing phosphohydrolase [unclassified Pseudodesulfovibrio]|uniref:HD-GYP domain-containing protein n=1 Tax=unclassified Pseudodesulfovibrio TaxID=2661612 RepID=UPI000FEBC49C|nr:MULTISPECIES: HD domain-containing phosphohydrolase [unclassified Pseudodesulfovibrio]MCJ2164891.1 HD domain-containing protein [Pseudodesulfovibrio sp. S3-i]RWU03743.1 HD domain-containing protein [Pseudodesulfovibrio sp. S3]